jgi:hypothetical protein
MAPQFDRAPRDLLRAAGCTFVRGSHEIYSSAARSPGEISRCRSAFRVAIRQCHPAPSWFTQGVLSCRGPDRCVRYASRVRLRGALRTYTALRRHQQLSTRPGKSQQIIDRKANGLSRTCISSEQNKMCHRPLSRPGATSVCTSFRSGRSFVSQRTEVMCQNPTFRGCLGAQRGTSQDPVTAILHFGRVRGTVLEPVAANETARVHHRSRRHSRVAAHSARAAVSDAGGRISRRAVAFAICATCSRLSLRLEGSRLRRGQERRHRISLGGGAI